MKLSLLLWAIGVGCAAGMPHADTFTQRFAIELKGQAPYYALPLPANVYAASQRGDMGDIRVFNGAGELVPYSLEAPVAPSVKSEIKKLPVPWFPLPANNPSVNATVLGVTIAPDGSLHAATTSPQVTSRTGDVVDVGQVHGGLVGLQIHIGNDSYQGHVGISASDDLRTWRDVAEADLLKLSSSGSSLKQERVDIDGLQARYLKLDWPNGAPTIQSVEVEVRQQSGDGAQSGLMLPRQWVEKLPAVATQQAGEYVFDTGGHYPVDRIRLSLPQINTVARATLFSRNDVNLPWLEVSGVQLYRLRAGNGGAGEQSNPSLEIPANTDRYWRLLVDMRNGGLGSGTPTVTLGWRPAMLTFVARGDEPFSLAVGNSAMSSAAQARDELVVGSAANSIASAQLGGVLSLPVKPVIAAVKPDTDATRRYILWGALVLAVAVLGVMAWRLSRSHPPHHDD